MISLDAFFPRIRKFLILGCRVVPFVLLSFNANADQCYSSYMLKRFPDPLKIVLDRTDIIFIGEVKAISKKTLESKDSEGPFIVEQKTAFGVLGIVFGESSKENLSIHYDLDHSEVPCSCHYEFEIGKKYLVFASERGKGEKHLTTLFCGYIKDMDTSESGELINTLKKRLNGE